MGGRRFISCPSMVIILAAGALIPPRTMGEETTWPDPPGLIDATQQSLLEQIYELAQSGPASEAISQLKRLSDAPLALAPVGNVQLASTQRIRVYHTLQQICRIQLQRILDDHPDLQQTYGRQWNQQAAVAFEELQRSKDPLKGLQALSQYHATASGNSLARLLSDIYLENQQCLAAMHVLNTQFPELARLYLPTLAAEAPSVALPWHQVYRALRSDETASERLLQQWDQAVQDRSLDSADVLRRQLIAAAIDPRSLDYPATVQWAGRAKESIADPLDQQKVNETIAEAENWMAAQPSQLPSQQPSLDQWPRWQVQLERYSNSHDETPATKPPVGELQALLPYRPVVYEGRVFLHELTRIRAFEIKDGKSWPNGQAELVLFDSQISPVNYLPLGYPLQGSPKAEVSVYAGCLYARMGSPVTAWANRSRSSDGSSMSYLIGLDLDNQGRMLRGFPLRLSPPDFVNCEFEGTPIAYRQLVIATIAQRDQSNIRRSLAAFDRFSGRLVWQSQILGSGSVVGSDRANLISHTQPVLAGGLVYYCSDLGTICCLNALNGQTIWMAQYQRSRQIQSEYPTANRFRYRNGNPCLVHEGLLYCLPQDCPELIALDALSGDLVWATNDTEVADSTSWVGFHERSLIVNGDRLVWLDKREGNVLGSFPEPTTPGIVNSLPQPRSLGRACIIEDQVYMPVSGEILIFSATPNAGNQKMLNAGELRPADRFSTQSRGIEGGHLVSADDLLLMTTPGRLVCFEAEDRSR